MRPSYDGEHPVAPTPTPIYDELYSEYRRLFRALPGDRSGEEDMRFTGFAVRERSFPGAHPGSHAGLQSGSHPGQYAGPADGYRDPYGNRTSYVTDHQLGALSQHQSFPTYASQLPNVPQFVPQQQAVQHQSAHQQYQGAAYPPHSQQPQHPQQQPQHLQQQQSHQQQRQQNHHQPPQAQSSTGHGWVAAGYLSPITAPAPATPAPAPPGRHRGALLSLPPGRG
jgi:hypothetical protein